MDFCMLDGCWLASHRTSFQTTHTVLYVNSSAAVHLIDDCEADLCSCKQVFGVVLRRVAPRGAEPFRFDSALLPLHVMPPFPSCASHAH
jgi:hypothetical protein